MGESKLGGVSPPLRIVGRYALYDEIASGGMATVHFGRLLGPVGFARTVAVKRLHEHLAKDPDFAAMFLDEARVAARIQHPNVVSTIDVVALDGEMFLVMEYVDGEALSKLLRASRERSLPVDPRIAVAIVSAALHGLHAAHEARNERGEPLEIVHRDVSPQNILVGRDGGVRVLDFGVAKAAGKLHTTREGSLKGKVAYMPPEQLRSQPLDRRADVYAASVVLWESLAVRKLFQGENEAALLEQILFSEVDPPSKHAKGISPELDAIVMKGLAREREQRWATAREMALELERVANPAMPSAIADWVTSVAEDTLAKRALRVSMIESSSDISSLAIPRSDEVTKAAADASGALAAIGVSSTGSLPAVAPSGPLPAAASGGTPALTDSQLSSISVARGPASTSSARGSRGLVVVFGAIAGLALLALVVVLVVKPGAAPAAPIDSHPSATAVALPSATNVAPTASAAVSAAVTPTAVASAVPSASASTAKPRPTGATGVTGVTGRSTATAAASSEDCKVPYTVDANGNMIYKRQCL